MDLSLNLKSLREAFTAMASSLPLVFSFSCYKVILILVFAEAFVFKDSSASFASPPYAIFLVTCACVCAITAILARRNNRVFMKDWYLGFLLTVALVGILLLFLRTHADVRDIVSKEVCLFLGSVLLSIGFMGSHIEFGRMLGHLGVTQTIAFCITNTCVGVTIYLITYSLPSMARWGILALLFILMVFFFHRSRKVFSLEELYGVKREMPLFVPYKFMTTALIQGLAFGTLYLYGVHFFQVTAFMLIAFVGSAILALIVLFVLFFDFDRAIYRIGFPIIAGGMMLSAFFIANPVVGTLSQLFGFLYLDCVLWALGSYLIKGLKQPATWVCSMPTAAQMIGRASGAATHDTIAQESILTGLYILAFLIMLAALWLSSGRNIKTGWGFVRPGSQEADSNLVSASIDIAQEFMLTPREVDVLRTMVSGKSTEEIAKLLFISTNTTKSHIQNIYNKVGVHSRKELLAVIINRQHLLSAPFDY